MSFHNQAFWMEKSHGSSNDGDMTCDNSSRFESKRTNQWFMDGPEVDVSPNKKQAVEVPNNLSSGMLNSNISRWGNSSSFHSLTDHHTAGLFDPAAATLTFEDPNICSLNIDKKLSMERKNNMDPFGGGSSFGLSMSTTFEDPQSIFNNDGVRKVKVNEVKEESENVIPFHANIPYHGGVSSALSNIHAYKGGDNSISTSLAYNKGDATVILLDNAYDRTVNDLMSVSQSYNKRDGSLTIPPTYKEVCNTMPMDREFSKVDSNVMSIAPAYNKARDNSMPSNHLFNKFDDCSISMGNAYHHRGNGMPFVSHSYNKGESTIISFGGCDYDDTTPSSLFISNYGLSMGQPSLQNLEALNEKEWGRCNSRVLPSTVQTSACETENVPKTKEEMKMSKKATSNNFPSNVRSLLSTGMLDGVSVKYKAWSREKELRAVIKGAGYLCSCQTCNFSKVINAYEFERHAGCKTKHPNNHIYFENGKTIYGVVQELRSTPQNMLFEVIQTITGSPINQKSFRIWKESFLAAAHELQRICGIDEVKQLL